MFVAFYYFWKILEQTKAGLWAPRCHKGRSHNSVTCCLLKTAEMEEGPHSGTGPLGRRRCFCRFCADFCLTLEHLSFERQNVEEKSAQQSAHYAPKHLRANDTCPNICAQKWAQHHTKTRCENFHLYARFKKTHKNLQQTCAKPQPEVLHWAPIHVVQGDPHRCLQTCDGIYHCLSCRRYEIISISHEVLILCIYIYAHVF